MDGSARKLSSSKPIRDEIQEPAWIKEGWKPYLLSSTFVIDNRRYFYGLLVEGGIYSSTTLWCKNYGKFNWLEYWDNYPVFIKDMGSERYELTTFSMKNSLIQEVKFEAFSLSVNV